MARLAVGSLKEAKFSGVSHCVATISADDLMMFKISECGIEGHGHLEGMCSRVAPYLSWPSSPAGLQAGKRGIIVGGWAELSEEPAPLEVAKDGSSEWSSQSSHIMMIMMSSKRMVAP